VEHPTVSVETDKTDWKPVELIFPRRSCATRRLIDGLVMRRRYKGKWQYRELSSRDTLEVRSPEGWVNRIKRVALRKP
jgi:hypothetical protein